MHVWNRFGAIVRRCAFVALLCPSSFLLAGELPQRHKSEHPFPKLASASPHLADGFTSVNAAPGATFAYPTAFAISPDGMILVGEKGGAVFVIENGVKDPSPFLDLRAEVLSNGDRGLTGLAFDPNFLSNGYVYFGYEVDPDSDGVDDNPSSFGRVVRYTVMTGDRHHADASTRLILIGHDWSDGIADPYLAHTIDALRFGNDGTLLVSAGDGGHFEYADAGGNDPNGFGEGKLPADENIGSLRAQNPNSLSGKILRIDPATGDGLSSNPWYTGNPSEKASKVWCIGLRNPFRFTVQPGTGVEDPAEGDPGVLFIPDCGWFTWEEVNYSVHGGDNFGWPCHEGFRVNDPFAVPCDTFSRSGQVQFHDPVYSWNHTDPSASVPPGYTGWCAIGGAYYTGSSYPAQYQGALFVADYQDWIRVARISSIGTFQSVELFADGLGEPVDMAINPADGDLYYLSLLAGEVRHIRYNAPQPVPTARVSGGPVMGPAPLNLQLSGAGSLDGGQAPISYEWSDQWNSSSSIFSTGVTPQYTIQDQGSHCLNLRVTNATGNSDTAQLYVAAIPDAPLSYDITGHGTAAASRSLNVLGRARIDVISDSRFPPIDSRNDALQFTTSSGGASPAEDWIGYTFPSPVQMTGLVYESGIVSPDGGAFDNLHIQIQQDSVWQDVPDWTAAPLLTAPAADSSFTIHLIRFGDHTGTGIRMIGVPSGNSHFVSCAEMRVLAKTQFPIAHASATPGNGRVKLIVQFSSNGSADPAGLGLTTAWDFGDGSTSTESSPLHTYLRSGVFNARLLVTNEAGSSAQDSVSVSVSPNTKPHVTIVTPTDSSLHRIGETIHLRASGTDPDPADAALQFTWRIDLHHNHHIHPEYFTSQAQECDVQMSGHGDNDSISYEVIATATDAGGLSDTARIWLLPNHPPAFWIDSTSLNPSGGYLYRFVLIAEDVDPHDSLRIESIRKPDWLTIASGEPVSNSWIVFGTPPPGNQIDSVVTLRVVDRAGEADTISFPLHQVEITNVVSSGWNLLSLSRIPVSRGLKVLFPTAVSSGFSFEAQRYAAVDTLIPGRGYWIKFPSEGVFALGGIPLATDTLNLGTGWNMVGAPDGVLATTSLSTIPAGAIRSEFYSYSNGYSAADTLRSGYGYWVKIGEPCTMIIGSEHSVTKPSMLPMRKR